MSNATHNTATHLEVYALIKAGTVTSTQSIEKTFHDSTPEHLLELVCNLAHIGFIRISKGPDDNWYTSAVKV